MSRDLSDSNVLHYFPVDRPIRKQDSEFVSVIGQAIQRNGWRIFFVNRAGFVCFRFPFNPLKFTPHQRNWRTKNLSNFAKLQFISDKINQNTNFAKLPRFKWLFFCTTLNFIIQELKFCKIAQLFYVP